MSTLPVQRVGSLLLLTEALPDQTARICMALGCGQVKAQVQWVG